MKEELITFETAKLAKEKGFLWTTLYAYGAEEEISVIEDNSDFTGWINFNGLTNSEYWNVSAPTQSLLQKWLRDKHEIFIYCLPNKQQNEIKWTNNFHNREGIHFDTFEDALEVGLQEALKLIIKKRKDIHTSNW